jgi:hypothetical protein
VRTREAYVAKLSGRKPQPLPFSPLEQAQLRRLVDQAFELRTSAYLHDAVAAIVAWNERTLPDRLERRARRRVA